MTPNAPKIPHRYKQITSTSNIFFLKDALSYARKYTNTKFNKAINKIYLSNLFGCKMFVNFLNIYPLQKNGIDVMAESKYKGIFILLIPK